jgi:large subunit ribosomal protein L25
MERIKLVAFPREMGSKGKTKQLRSKGMVPGVVYGQGDAPIPVTLESIALKKALSTAGGMNVLLDMEIKGEEGAAVQTVMVKELQRHPLKYDFLVHADLLRISLDEKLEVKVPLIFVGEPLGVKEGGLFQVQYREVRVQCLPAEIPDSIEVPVEALNIGDSLSVADLLLPPGVEMLEEPDETLASVLIPQEEVEEAVEAPEEGVPGAETEEAPAEPDAEADNA